MTEKSFKFKTNPWEHQLKALEYLYARDTAALYTDMGTGKSKVMIDLIVNRGFRNVLIVCTAKGCSVWKKQFQIHSDIPQSSVVNLSGVPTPEKLSLITNVPNLGNFGGTGTTPFIVLINYEGIWREQISRYLMRKSVKIDCIICDESHRIKSPGSKCSRFLTKLSKKSPCRYLVTGTPLAENPMDIYAQYRFLDPSIFGTSFSSFKERYENVDVQASMACGYTVLNKKEPYVNLDELREKMFSCAFYAKSSLKLPKQRNIIVEFNLSAKAQKLYKELSEEGVLAFDEGLLTVDNVLARVVRQLQLTSGVVQIEDPCTKEKTLKRVDTSRAELLQELLENLPRDEPVVVFANFITDFDEIARVCNITHRKYSELRGGRDTEQLWQQGKTSVIIVQYVSGSESVDFTRARYCIYYGLTHSLAKYLQSKKRVHRPGQVRNCIYYHFVAKNTIDTKVIQALKNKQDVVEYIMEQEKHPSS